MDAEALRGLQGIRGIMAVFAPDVWVPGGADPTKVSSKRVFQNVGGGNQSKGKVLAVVCHTGSVTAPRAESKVAISLGGDDDVSCPKGALTFQEIRTACEEEGKML